jgi:hypothetical protein
MSRTDLRKVIANFIILIVLVICFIFITDSHLIELSTAMGQSQKKTISYSKWNNQPVEFVKVKAAGKHISLKAQKAHSEYKEEFDGDDDWLKGLVVHLKNTSNKNIIYINFHLSFPETDVGGPRMAESMTFGQYPEKPNVGSSDKVLKPGEELEISLTDKKHTDLYYFLRSRNFHQVNSLQIALQFVIFEDDTAWAGGVPMKRDPFNWTSWVKIDQ